MIQKLLERFQKMGQKRLKESDIPLLKILVKEGKTRQYQLEKALEKDGNGLQHSTVTSKLLKLVNGGYIARYEENEGRTYYEITPIGVAYLIYKGKLEFKKALTYFRDRPILYYDLLARMQPDLKTRLQKVPPFFVDQVTDDLWIFYHISDRLDLRRATLEFLLKRSKLKEYQSEPMKQDIQLLCVNRIDVAGKAICVKKRAICSHPPSDILNCSIIRPQVLKELERLKKKRF